MAPKVDPFSPEFLADPYPAFRRLRDESPVHFVESRNMWMVTRYEDIVAVARNTAVFSSTGGVGYDWNSRPMMPMYDPPEHSRMRRMVARHFTPAAITAFKPRVDGMVEDILGRALQARDVDVVKDIALPLSLGTIAELLGVPTDLRAQLRRWSQGTVEDLAGGLAPTPARRVDELRREFNVYLKSLIEERRASLGAQDGAIDVITALVSATEEEKLTKRELVAFCVLLLVAGYETTVNAIANGVLALLAHPAELDKLRKDRSLLGPAVEEMVRYDGPVLSFFRNTLSEATVGGTVIPKGAKVMIAFASGNRDERKYEEPDAFRVDRRPAEHLAYGAGVHYCLGAPLARLQLTAIFSALLDHVAAIEPTGEAVRSASVLFRGAKTLPVRLTPAASAERPSPRPSTPSVVFGLAKPDVPSPPEPYRLDVADEVLSDLQSRLNRARFPDEVEWAGWDYGTARGYLQELVAYWHKQYDWRAHEARINAMPQFRMRVADVDVHYFHHKAKTASSFPLLVLHGWPGPSLLFQRIVEPLTNAGFELIVPALPGFPLSGAAKKRGMGTLAMADAFADMMRALGFSRYGVVGEDIGAAVAGRMGLVHGGAVAAIHVNMPIDNPSRDQFKQLTPEERAWLSEFLKFKDRELTHLVTHAARPQTLGYGLNDSPVGLAAWLLEKYRSWSGCDGEVESVFSKDDLLTFITLYWATGRITSSVRTYLEMRQIPQYLAEGERIEVPCAIALTKHELLQPPRRFIERSYNVQRFTQFPSGGHFSAWELPGLVADDIRSFFEAFAPKTA